MSQLETIARCEMCGGIGEIDSGGQLPWGEAIFIRCGHCSGTGKAPPPEEMCELFEMCELQNIHPELKAAVGALILRCMDAEIKLRRLPADWFEDSSLETWFPLTAKTLATLTAQRDRLRVALEALVASLTKGNRGDDRMLSVDNWELRELLKQARAALSEATKEATNASNSDADQR